MGRSVFIDIVSKNATGGFTTPMYTICSSTLCQI